MFIAVYIGNSIAIVVIAESAIDTVEGDKLKIIGLIGVVKEIFPIVKAEGIKAAVSIGGILCLQKLESPSTHSLDPSIANTRWAGWHGALPWRRTLDVGRK